MGPWEARGEALVGKMMIKEEDEEGEEEMGRLRTSHNLRHPPLLPK